jgi:hypothetical protein
MPGAENFRKAFSAVGQGTKIKLPRRLYLAQCCRGNRASVTRAERILEFVEGQ